MSDRKEKFTEGPWECGKAEEGESDLMVYCLDTTGQRIADCTNSLTFHPLESKKANAQLIATAPGLYGVLKSAYIGGVTSGGSIHHKIKDILEKATGLKIEDILED